MLTRILAISIFSVVLSPCIAHSAVFVGLDLSNVTTGSPDFTNQNFVVGTFSTFFDGTVTSSSGTIRNTLGNSDGDLAIGGASGSQLTYNLTFDDPVLLKLSNEISIGFVTGPFDDFVVQVTIPGVSFVVDDPGVSDLNVISNASGTINFTGVNGGDENWSVTISGAVTSLDITFTNTAGGGNVRPLNIAAAISAPEPSAIIVWGLFGLTFGNAIWRQQRKAT